MPLHWLYTLKAKAINFSLRVANMIMNLSRKFLIFVSSPIAIEKIHDYIGTTVNLASFHAAIKGACKVTRCKMASLII